MLLARLTVIPQALPVSTTASDELTEHENEICRKHLPHRNGAFVFGEARLKAHWVTDPFSCTFLRGSAPILFWSSPPHRWRIVLRLQNNSGSAYWRLYNESSFSICWLASPTSQNGNEPLRNRPSFLTEPRTESPRRRRKLREMRYIASPFT